MLLLFSYILLGSFAGLLAGLFGVGGGLIVVPGLMFIFTETALLPHHSVMHFAAGTSLGIMIATVCSSTLAHIRYDNILWPVFLKMLPGIIIGVTSGALLAKISPNRLLEILFAFFLLLMSFKMFFLLHVKSSHSLPSQSIISIISLITGVQSGLLGIGGGAIIIPFLTYCNIPMRKAAGTTAVCTLPIAIFGATSFILTGWSSSTSIPYTTGYIYWPAFFSVALGSVLFAPFGAKLATTAKTKTSKRLFALFLLIVSIRLLLW